MVVEAFLGLGGDILEDRWVCVPLSDSTVVDASVLVVHDEQKYQSAIIILVLLPDYHYNRHNVSGVANTY